MTVNANRFTSLSRILRVDWAELHLLSQRGVLVSAHYLENKNRSCSRKVPWAPTSYFFYVIFFLLVYKVYIS